MTDREKFEAAMISADKGYMLGKIFRLFEEWTPDELYGIWQESRRQALAEAVNICEESEDFSSEDLSLGFCLHNLRRLANTEGDQE